MVSDNKDIAAIMAPTMMGIFGIWAMQSILLTVIQPREATQLDTWGAIWLSPAGHIMNVSYSAGDVPEYFGEALPGTANNQPGWRIYRYEYVIVDGDLEVAGIRFASGNTLFDKVWDNREDYEYS